MAHLYKIGIENFRVFKEFTEIEFAPITIFTGANNSGKSSVIKAIQLLKSNFSTGSGSDLILSFISGDHKLSRFDDVVNDPVKPLKFILPMILRGNNENLSIAFTYKKNEKNELGEGIISSIELFSEKGERVFQFKMDGSNPKASTNFNYFYKKLLKLIDYLESYQKEYDSKEEAYNNSEEKKDAYKEHPFYNLSNDNIIKIRGTKRKIGFYPYPVIDNYGPVAFLGGKSNDQKTIEPKFDKTGLINPLFLLLYLIRERKINLSIWTEQYSSSYHKEEENQKETVIYSYLKIENDLTDENILTVKKQIEKLFLDDLSLIEENIWNTTENDQIYEYRFHYVYLLKKQLKDKLYQDIFFENGEFKNTEFASGVFSGSQADINIGHNLDFFLEDYIEKNLSLIFKNTGAYFKQIAKLDSVRANTQRIYTYSSQGTSFNDLLLSILKGNLNKGFNSEEFLNKWLNKFGIKGKLEVSNSQPGVGITVTIGGRQLADLGYGLTQLLPILLKIILVRSQNDNLYEYSYAEPNSGNNFSSTLIIEEPETNLHPKFQSMLADLFVDASRKYRIQFIIETHSEYLIRKLQYLTGKGDLKPADTSLYYFYHPDEKPVGEKQVKKIEILEDGSLSSDFGTGFFDEALNWKFELLKLKNKN